MSEPNVQPISAADGRSQIRVMGTVVRWRTQPVEALPRLEIVIEDESGRATVVWSGRRRLGGVHLGGRLIVEGVPVASKQGPTFVNPEYSLVASH